MYSRSHKQIVHIQHLHYCRILTYNIIHLFRCQLAHMQSKPGTSGEFTIRMLARRQNKNYQADNLNILFLSWSYLTADYSVYPSMHILNRSPQQHLRYSSTYLHLHSINISLRCFMFKEV